MFPRNAARSSPDFLEFGALRRRRLAVHFRRHAQRCGYGVNAAAPASGHLVEDRFFFVGQARTRRFVDADHSLFELFHRIVFASVRLQPPRLARFLLGIDIDAVHRDAIVKFAVILHALDRGRSLRGGVHEARGDLERVVARFLAEFFFIRRDGEGARGRGMAGADLFGKQRRQIVQAGFGFDDGCWGLVRNGVLRGLDKENI